MEDKKKKPVFEDAYSEMYKPPFVPHERRLCKDINKSIVKNISKKNKLYTPGSAKK